MSSVTSIKSMDITLKTYKNSSKLRSKLKGYVDELAAFTNTTYKKKRYILDNSADKILEIAVPPVEMTNSQAKVFDEIIEYAKELNIKFDVKIVK